jgi:hypothetical protein
MKLLSTLLLLFSFTVIAQEVVTDESEQIEISNAEKIYHALNVEEELYFDDTSNIVQDIQTIFYKEVGGFECIRTVMEDESLEYTCGVAMDEDTEFDPGAIYNAFDVEAETIIWAGDDEVHDYMKKYAGLSCIELHDGKENSEPTHHCTFSTSN